MLVYQEYIPDPNQRFIDTGSLVAPINFEVAGTGYAEGFSGSGRKIISGKQIIRDTASFRIRLFGNDVQWNNINVGIVGGILIIREGSASDANSLLIGYTDEGGFPIPTDGGELQVRWNVGGILVF